MISIVAIFVSKGQWQTVWFLSMVVSAFFGLILLSLGIMAEYIGQIMTEVKGRPISVIYEYMPSGTAVERLKE